MSSTILYLELCKSGDERQDSEMTAEQESKKVEACHSGFVETYDLRRRTTRGVLISLGGQGANFVMRAGSTVVLARLLTPKDFGLVGMVTAATGILGLFKDAGLSAASVQHAAITRMQASTLFWINVALGSLLTVLCAAAAPAVAGFYGDRRLLWVTVASSVGFLFSGASAQHQAMLQRNMRFGVLAAINIITLLLSTAVGIGMALAGFGYWALVGGTLSSAAINMFALWVATGWIPGRPERGSGVGSMLKYGGALTLNGLVVYLTTNADKVLLGRVWGAEALGIYGRAYQLVNLPTDNLFTTIGGVAFPALSKLQNEPERLRSYFLKGYTLFLSLVMPVTVWCALFADDIIAVMLGAKWHEAAPIFRLLAPTTLVFGLANPISWLMMARGQGGRLLRIALVICPVVIIGYLLGLSDAGKGVAAGFSIAMTIILLPVLVWGKHGTLITIGDLGRAILKPCLAVAIGLVLTLPLAPVISAVRPAFLKLLLESAGFFGGYALALLFGMGQWSVYWKLFRETGIWRRGSGAATAPEPVL